MTRPKRQHYVPKFYLSHFTDSDGLIWVYDKINDTVRSAKPKDTAVETNFYSFKNDSGEYNDQLEEWLSKVESLAASLYESVLAGEIPTGQKKADFAVFLSSLFTRSPAMASSAAIFHGSMAQHTMDLMASSPKNFRQSIERFAKETGRPVDSFDKEELRQFILDKDRYSVNVSRKGGLLTALKSTDKLTELFCNMSWNVGESKEQHLITSDNPVVNISGFKDRFGNYRSGGFTHKSAFVTIPLHPSKVLELNWSSQLPNGLYPMNKETGRDINRQRACYAERYLFSSSRDAGIQMLGKKHSKPGLRMTSSQGKKLAPIKIKR